MYNYDTYSNFSADASSSVAASSVSVELDKKETDRRYLLLFMLSFTTTRSIPTGAGLAVVDDVVENDERGINAVAAFAAATARTAEAMNFLFYFFRFLKQDKSLCHKCK